MTLMPLFVPDYHMGLIAPPYETFSPIDTRWSPVSMPPRGLGLIWWLLDGTTQQNEFQWLYYRPPGLPLFIILPPASDLQRTLPLLNYINALNPRSVLPSGPSVTPRNIRRLLASTPQQIPETLTHYFVRRKLIVNDSIRRLIYKVLESAPKASSITQLAKRLYTSRRTLGRQFAAAGLPVPSHWLQITRIFHTIFRIQTEETTVNRIAARSGYPDGFTLSNQMKRLMDCRPTDVRNNLGWEWVIEQWIKQETYSGGIDRQRYYEAVHMYLDESLTP